MADRIIPGWRARLLSRLIEFAILASTTAVLLFLVGVLSFKQYQPPEGTTTVEQLVAHLPETFKFALVRKADRDYVVWLGKPRGAIVSGPPVYVFDRNGALVDRVGDSGETDNRFVLQLYSMAFDREGITPEEALASCRRSREAPPRPILGGPPPGD